MIKIIITALGLFLMTTPALAVAAVGSPYVSSNLGFDVTFSTRYFPAESFGFAIVGVTGGKAFVDNKRLSAGYAWTQFASHTAATVYMNLNAPYGSTVEGHVGSPKACSGTKTGAEPTACQGYNYGYQAADHSYRYAQERGVQSALWWLDIEEANSWSKDTAVNAATIQGAIDYLNTKSIRVGIYSMPRMWRTIAGSGFIPAQKIAGQDVLIPVWLPVGVKSQVGAINTCVTGKSFIAGSPIWIVQYEASSTAIDQNIAC